MNFSSIIQMVFPVLLMLAIGCMCKYRKLFDDNGLEALKKIIGSITLPVVLFNAFYTADYNRRMALVFVVIFAACGISLGVGFLLRKYLSPYGKFAPFLMANFEGGMLGYPLFTLIVGTSAIGTMAIVDIGQTMFAYTVFLISLKLVNGDKATVKGIVKNMLTTPPFVGMLLGIILGSCGVYRMLGSSAISGIISETISFITAPTAALILIIVGYELSVKKELLKPVFKTILFRFTMMAILCAISALVIFAFTPYDKNLIIALMLLL